MMTIPNFKNGQLVKTPNGVGWFKGTLHVRGETRLLVYHLKDNKNLTVSEARRLLATGVRILTAYDPADVHEIEDEYVA